MEVFGIVYVLINTVNNKMYVGQTIQPLKRRFSQHACCKKSAIGNAIRYHGRENFSRVVLKKCTSKIEMDKWERFFIIALNTKSPFGYNITDGGDGIVGVTNEIRKKISEANTGEKNPNYGKPRPLETCEKIAAAQRGEKSHWFGKHQSLEVCNQISMTSRSYSPFKNLLTEIDKRQLTYKSLAKLMGLSDQSVSYKMICKRNFTARDIVKLVEIFELSAEYLIKREDD